MTSVFWEDLNDELRDDPARMEQFALEVERIEGIDRAINLIDQARTAREISKAELAMKVGKNPAWLRRLFTRRGQNPQYGTVVAMAAAVGYRVEFVPIDDSDSGTDRGSGVPVRNPVSGDLPRIA